MKTGVSVPLLDLEAQYRPIREEILVAITRVCDSQRFIMGPEVEALERELARACGVTHAISMSSGTDAILATLMTIEARRANAHRYDELTCGQQQAVVATLGEALSA